MYPGIWGQSPRFYQFFFQTNKTLGTIYPYRNSIARLLTSLTNSLGKSNFNNRGLTDLAEHNTFHNFKNILHSPLLLNFLGRPHKNFLLLGFRLF